MFAHARFALVVAIVLGAIFFLAAPAQTQCMYPTDLMSPVFCYNMLPSGDRACIANLRTPMTGGTMSYWSCTPQFPMGPMSPTDYTGVTVCSYIMGQRRLYAKRPTTGSPTMAFCQVSCPACGILRLDEGDGLPVELLDFSVDEEDDKAEEDTGDE